MKTTIKLCIAAAICLSAVACKKSRENTAPAYMGTNELVGNWKVYSYNNLPLQVNQSGSLIGIATAANTGTVHFDMFVDSMHHNIEDDIYTLRNGNSEVTFSKSDGSYSTLVSGGVWHIDSAMAHVLVLRSQYNLVIRCSK